MNARGSMWLGGALAALACCVLAVPAVSLADDEGGKPGGRMKMSPEAMARMHAEHLKMVEKLYDLLGEARKDLDYGRPEQAGPKVSMAQAMVGKQIRMMQEMARKMGFGSGTPKAGEEEKMRKMKEEMRKKMGATKEGMQAQMEKMMEARKREMGARKAEMEKRMEGMKREMERRKEEMRRRMEEQMRGGPGRRPGWRWRAVNPRCPTCGRPLPAPWLDGRRVRHFRGRPIGFCGPQCARQWDRLDDRGRAARLEHHMGWKHGDPPHADPRSDPYWRSVLTGDRREPRDPYWRSVLTGDRREPKDPYWRSEITREGDDPGRRSRMADDEDDHGDDWRGDIGGDWRDLDRGDFDRDGHEDRGDFDQDWRGGIPGAYRGGIPGAYRGGIPGAYRGGIGGDEDEEDGD